MCSYKFRGCDQGICSNFTTSFKNVAFLNSLKFSDLIQQETLVGKTPKIMFKYFQPKIKQFLFQLLHLLEPRFKCIVLLVIRGLIFWTYSESDTKKLYTHEGG